MKKLRILSIPPLPPPGSEDVKPDRARPDPAKKKAMRRQPAGQKKRSKFPVSSGFTGILPMVPQDIFDEVDAEEGEADEFEERNLIPDFFDDKGAIIDSDSTRMKNRQAAVTDVEAAYGVESFKFKDAGKKE